MSREGKRRGCRQSGTTALKISVNILFSALFAALAVFFLVYGLNFRSLKFISEHYQILLWLAVGVPSLMLVLFVLFVAFGKTTAYRLILCALICLDIAAVVFGVLSATGVLAKLTSIDELRRYISEFGVWAVAIFILFQFLQVIILPVPGSVSVGVGVALFGSLKCTIFSFIGIMLGSLVAFAIGRGIGYKAVLWIVGKEELDKWLKKMRGKDYLLLSIMFLLPLFPDDILCFVAGLSSMTWKYFLIMITITRAISVSTTSYSLQLIPFTSWWGILIWVLIGVAVVAAFVLVCKYSTQIDSFLKRKFKRKR